MSFEDLEEVMKSMEGKQMPVLIAGENWWPQRYVDEAVRLAVVAARKEWDAERKQAK